MKKLMTSLVLLGIGLLLAPLSVRAETTATSADKTLVTGKTTAEIEFKASETAALTPVNPDNPNESQMNPMVGNGDIINGSTGASFVYVTKNMVFEKGAHLIDLVRPQTYSAEVALNTPESKTRETMTDAWQKNFVVEVADGRGVDANWRLTMSASPLTANTDSGQTVTGAALSWPKGTIHRSGENAKTASTEGNALSMIDLNKDSNEILSVSGKKAAGYVTAQFDPSEIKLTIPANSTKPGTYSTTLNWNLADVATR
ncbi:WxL domain-containing protein [Lactiplantibacillus pingfangensis]|uniref:WxL domain-containing protein n=1 Tax=Lactiplantibacillus pingfangensis TaxID=2559915 RepID=UPI0010F6EC75|nr:WxL domain-containing protein [Lactiplantibacillus pingfangensis]